MQKNWHFQNYSMKLKNYSFVFEKMQAIKTGIKVGIKYKYSLVILYYHKSCYFTIFLAQEGREGLAAQPSGTQVSQPVWGLRFKSQGRGEEDRLRARKSQGGFKLKDQFLKLETCNLHNLLLLLPCLNIGLLDQIWAPHPEDSDAGPLALLPLLLCTAPPQLKAHPSFKLITIPPFVTL